MSVRRFIEVVPGKLFRGSAPSPLDVAELKKQLGIKKIVSLDEQSGNNIDRTCKLLGIEHVKLYINDTRKTLLHFLSQNLKKLLLEGGPVFVHCRQGLDRTGLAIALLKCKYFGVSPQAALKEAEHIGLGRWLPEKVKSLYEKIILSCKKAKDTNSADIVSNERDYTGGNSDNRNSFLDESHQHSFAPYLDPSRTDAPYNSIADQEVTRQDIGSQDLLKQMHDFSEMNVMPQIGVFNNDGGSQGTGPTINMNGFLYE